MRITAGPLVSTAWLAEHAAAPGVLALEVNGEAARYYDGHVPGTLPLDWLDDLHAPTRRGFLQPPGLAELLGSLGVSSSTHVVLLGDAYNSYAASTYWLLYHHGHRNLSLVDGGRQAWEAEGRPLSTHIPVPVPVHYPVPTPDQSDRSVRATREDILTRFVTGDPGTAVLDCRNVDAYEGHGARGVDLPVEQHRVQGRMPGSENFDSTDAIDPVSHRFLPPEDLKAMFALRGVGPGTDVALYCRLADRSALLWFALHEIVGHRQARVYDGGWTEYGSLVDVPVER